MAEKIDELQLGITSNAQSAIDELGDLASALERTARAANSLTGTGGSLANLASGLSSLSNAKLGDIASGLKAITDVNFRKLSNKKVKIDVDISNLENLERLSRLDFSQFANFRPKDVGINSFLNAFKKLADVDTSKFDTGFFSSFTTALGDISKISGTSKEINSFVSSLAKLANAGTGTFLAADGIRSLTPAIIDAIKAFNETGDVNRSVSQLVSSLGRLASAGTRTTDTAYGLDYLAAAVVRFIETMKAAPEISQNLAMALNGLGNLAAAGTTVNKVMGSVSSLGDIKFSGGFKIIGDSLANSMKKVLQVSLKLGGQGASALGNFMGKLGLIPSHAHGINQTALSFGNLLRTVMPFVGLRGVFGWLKESTELGSSVVEIQNVIDTAFGDLKKGYDSVAGHIYNWSKTTMDAFGVSEIAALRYAGRLQSIFNSSGFDVSESMRNSATQMTTDLIERAGDIASFYDISVDEAMTKMQAGLVGMVRPLRALGVNMSVANMEAFAMSQGIETSWKEMDQASQMALRYQYILSATQYAEGDFQRTSRSLANEMRLLSLNTQMLSTTIGQGLVSAIAPVVGWLNALIKRLIQAATAFRTFMWTLFGKPIAAAKGVADDLLGSLDDSADAVGDLGGGAGGASDGLGKAGKAAKELKKQLTVLPFDELNQLAKDTDSASSGGGSGGGGGGAGGLGGLDTGSLLPDFESEFADSPVVQAINRWAARIREAFEKHQWKNLGRIVAEGINAGFEYIYDALDYNKIKPKIVDGFIHPFQDVFNSMMHWIDWPLIGRTFARGLNDVVYILREWITGFEWRNYGTYFAEGLNAMIDGWDANAFGRLIADKFKMAWDFFGGFVETFNFTELGGKLKEGILGLLDELDFNDMGKSLAGFANGIADTLIEMLGDKKVKNDLADAFSGFVNSFLEEFDEEDASYALRLVGETIFGGLAKALGQIDKSQLIYELSTVLSSLPWGTIGILVGIKAGGSLAAGIFGHIFKQKAISILSGLFPSIGGSASAGASAVGGAAATGGGGIGSALTTAGIGGAFKAALVGVGIPAALFGLGFYMRSMVEHTGGIYQFYKKNLGSSDKTSVADSQTKNQQALNKAGINGAGYSTQIQTVTLKGKTDPSFTSTLADKAQLFKDPTALKTMDGKETSNFITARSRFHGIVSNTQTKTVDGRETSAFITARSNFHGIISNTQTKTVNGYRTAEFNNTRSLFHGIVSNTQTKTVDGSRTSAFNTARSYFHDIVSGWATKSVDGYRSGDFKTAYSDYTDINDKWATVHVDVDVDTAVTEIVADIQGAAQKVVGTLFTRTHRNAKGGLFTGATGFQVFGEAGAEAAIPLERKSTMKRIASAIVNSGGMATGSSSELADEIALRIAPIVASVVTGQNERPINVNATLYTENNEVLARAVNQGNRSLDKRYNPVAQFSY